MIDLTKPQHRIRTAALLNGNLQILIECRPPLSFHTVIRSPVQPDARTNTTGLTVIWNNVNQNSFLQAEVFVAGRVLPSEILEKEVTIAREGRFILPNAETVVLTIPGMYRPALEFEPVGDLSE